MPGKLTILLAPYPGAEAASTGTREAVAGKQYDATLAERLHAPGQLAALFGLDATLPQEEWAQALTRQYGGVRVCNAHRFGRRTAGQTGIVHTLALLVAATVDRIEWTLCLPEL